MIDADAIEPLPRHYATLRRQPLAPPPLKASFHYADG
jgi:hypothetical protein